MSDKSLLGQIGIVEYIYTIFGIRREKEPPYTVVVKEGAHEIRSYEGYVVVKTSSPTGKKGDRESFYRLFNYISKENSAKASIEMTTPVFKHSSEQIEMTAPVFKSERGGETEMVFVLPSRYHQNNAPQPKNRLVTLGFMKPKIVASLRYSGLATEQKAHDHEHELRLWIARHHYQAISKAQIALYDAPFTIPFLRRNEIHVEVKFKGALGETP